MLGCWKISESTLRLAAKARTLSQQYLALWKDADPNIPILKEAKAEYAKLQ